MKGTSMMNQKQEIIATRKGGFGGSDAKMFYKVGQKGIGSLSDTDKRRIAVALGQVEHVETFTSDAMEAGNEFEAWLWENVFTRERGWTNNYKLETPFNPERNFVTFAHADFFAEMPYTTPAPQKIVLECKYTGSSLKQTMDDYMAQLQWYFLQGADVVGIVKGTQGQPFSKYEQKSIHMDVRYVNILIKGIKLIDDFCETFVYEPKDEWGINDLLPYEQSAVIKMTSVLSEIKRMEQEAEELKFKLLETMLRHNVKSLKHDNYTLAVVPGGITSRFDKAKLLKDHPEIKESDYTTLSDRKAYLKINLK